MVAETFVVNAYAAIVSWTYILLVILIIAKILDFVTGGSLFRNWGRGGDDYERDRGGDGRDRRTGGGNREPREPRPEHPEGHTGRVIIRVQNIDRKGIPGVKVSIYTQGKRSWNWFVRKFKLAVISTPYVGRTDDNGVAEFHSVPAGNIIIELNKEGYHIMKPWVRKYFSTLRKGGTYFYTATYLEPEKDADLPPFTLLQTGDEAKGFEPTVDCLEFRPDGNADLTVRVT
ncbi:hypothetical protein AYK26_01105 [Euryarchaeota archaeon SM23-78]|nr:MAG: hypothetical protein AYK26_01105 [Euryarchaeota archaeon SM23-78]MBW3001228.1 hypothetical protein [Candidatus Woesearchaeota archaeon]